MAEGRNIPELGGYDYEFTSNVPECWECLVCHLTLKDPVQIEKCGHRLCNICMESLFRRPSPTCPADRQPLSRDQIFSDTACHRQILDLIVKCSHSECSWTGELRDVEKHQSECLFNVVKCSNSGCTEMLGKRDMKTHETLECSWRKVNCEYCQESVIMNQKQKHFDICRNFPVLCTNKCGLKDIPRQELEFHVRDECPATEVQCEYKNLGCEAVFPRSDAKSHAQTQIESHLNLALRGLDVTQHQVRELVTVMKDQSLQIERQSQHIERQSLQIERQSQQIERQSGQIERLIAKDNEQSQQIERQSQHIERQSLQIERQLQQIERHSGQIERLIAKDNEQSQQIERQSEKIERLISKDKEQSEKMERSMSAVKDPPPQKERCGPINEIFPTPFEFKIRSIGPVRQQARMSTQTLFSEPFYLFAQGYKYLLRIAIFLSSRKPLRGQRGALVYIKVVPGEFDELLSWPCKEKVRVTVVRGGHKKNKSAVTDFGEELCSRPLRDDHHTDRCILALTESQFVSCTKDDSILIRVNRE